MEPALEADFSVLSPLIQEMRLRPQPLGLPQIPSRSAGIGSGSIGAGMEGSVVPETDIRAEGGCSPSSGGGKRCNQQLSVVAGTEGAPLSSEGESIAYDGQVNAGAPENEALPQGPPPQRGVPLEVGGFRDRSSSGD